MVPEFLVDFILIGLPVLLKGFIALGGVRGIVRKFHVYIGPDFGVIRKALLRLGGLIGCLVVRFSLRLPCLRIQEIIFYRCLDFNPFGRIGLVFAIPCLVEPVPSASIEKSVIQVVKQKSF